MPHSPRPAPQASRRGRFHSEMVRPPSPNARLTWPPPADLASLANARSRRSCERNAVVKPPPEESVDRPTSTADLGSPPPATETRTGSRLRSDESAADAGPPPEPRGEYLTSFRRDGSNGSVRAPHAWVAHNDRIDLDTSPKRQRVNSALGLA